MKIREKNKEVYYNEIVDPPIFKELYVKEKTIRKFLTKVTTKTY